MNAIIDNLKMEFMRHELKIMPSRFEDILKRKKTFEIRDNSDRDFKVGDILLLHEFTALTRSYTGRIIWAEVCYIDDFEQKPGFVVLGLKNVELING